jgi:hypothetical protein
MISMGRGIRQKVVAAAAVGVLLAGGAIAAVSATGQRNVRRHHAAASTLRAIRLNALFSARLQLGEAAAAYLGTTPAALKSELHSGKTLAQLAGATAGKSTTGLIDALVAAEKRVPATRAASDAQLAPREKRLRRRATLLVQRKFGHAR